MCKITPARTWVCHGWLDTAKEMCFMMNTPPESFATPQGEIPEDTPVFDVNAEKVGTVVLSALRDGYFVVEKGMIFTHELYLPATAIQARDANGVSLRLTKDELKDD